MFGGMKPSFDDTCDAIPILQRVNSKEGFDNGIDLLVGINAEQRIGGAEISLTAPCIIALTMRHV